MAAPSGAPPLHPHDSDEIFEPLSDDEDFISGSEWSQEEESDGELDWDPDRERLLRSLRQTGQARPPPRSSSAKSLAERRNEWRASRGLQKQKSVQEIIAERRAAREEGRQPPAWQAAHGAAATAPTTASPPAAARPPPIQPPSDHRESAERQLEQLHLQNEVASALLRSVAQMANPLGESAPTASDRPAQQQAADSARGGGKPQQQAQQPPPQQPVVEKKRRPSSGFIWPWSRSKTTNTVTV